MTTAEGERDGAPNIAFRVDASAQMGTGHFMRCLALADALRRCGASVAFVSRRLPAHLREMLRARAIKHLPMDGEINGSCDEGLAHSSWLCASQAQDAAATRSALGECSWDWLIVDHYSLDARWETLLRASASRLAVIDDIADRPHDCDLLLDQNVQPRGIARYAGKVPAGCDMLLGPRFALLREEFRLARASAAPRSGKISRLLIFFGGIDRDNLTEKAMQALVDTGYPCAQVDVVVGALHPNRQQIEADCLRRGFACHVQTSRMAELIAAADLALGAGGIATWERCCLGLPGIVICTAENQREQIAAAAREGLVYAAGERPGLPLFTDLRLLMDDDVLRERISRAGFDAVDGRGAWRVADRLGGGAVEIRAARVDDARNLYEWRNHPAVRSVSRNSAPIDWNAHQVWLKAVLDTPARPLLIGYRGIAPLGVVRFDILGAEAEVSIYLVPGDHLPREGQRVLRGAERWLKRNRPEVHRIRAEVLGGNVRSEQLFLGAGYRAEGTRFMKRLGD